MADVDLIEDDPTVQRIVTRLLESRGHRVRLFGALEPAFAATLLTPPDLVITDLGLPDGDGAELVRRVRIAAPHLPVLVVSGLESDADRVRAQKAGANDFLAKPFGGEVLLARCAALLARARSLKLPHAV